MKTTPSHSPNQPLTLSFLATLVFSLFFSISVQADISAVDDTATVIQGDSVLIAILNNDVATDPFGEGTFTPTSFCIFEANPLGDCAQIEVTLTQPAHGTIEFDESNDIRYTPDRESDFTGEDSFEYAAYQVINGEVRFIEHDIATVTITINPVLNDNPEPTNDEEPNLTKEQQQVFNAVTSLCEELIRKESSTTCDVIDEAAIVALAADQVTAQRASTITIAKNQSSNINARLSQLKGQTQGLSIKGLSLNTESGAVKGNWLHAIYQSMSEPNQTEQMMTGGSAGEELNAPIYSPFGAFINGSITVGEKDANSNERGYDLDSDNITFGMDYRYSDQLVFGAAYGLSNSDIEFNKTGDDLENNTNTLFAYGSWFKDNFYLSSTLGYSFGDLETARRVKFGSVDTLTKGETDTSQFLFQLNTSYDMTYDAWSYGPYLKLDVIDGEIDSYTEKNGGGFEVAFDDQDISSQLVTLGAQAQYAISYSWGVLLPSTRFEIRNELDDSADAIKARFALDPSDTTFSITADDIDSLWFQAGAGLSAVFQYGLSAYCDVEMTSGLDDLSIYTYSLGGRWEVSF